MQVLVLFMFLALALGGGRLGVVRRHPVVLLVVAFVVAASFYSLRVAA